MKKMMTRTAMMLVVMTAMLSLTSCDSDEELAYQLDGVWQGEVASEFFSYRYGRTVEYYATEIHFHQRGSWDAGGTGYEVDSNGHTYMRTFFNWYVRNGRIYLTYDDASYTVVIRDFDTYWQGGIQHFKGYFDNASNNETLAYFDLIKVSSPGDYYENRYPYYYSRTAKADSVAVGE